MVLPGKKNRKRADTTQVAFLKTFKSNIFYENSKLMSNSNPHFHTHYRRISCFQIPAKNGIQPRMNDLDLISLFMLGILGTGHCLGMCGPLVFAFPGQTGKFTSHLWYHLGRGFTYVFMGAVMGGIGLGLAGLAKAGGGDYPVWITRIQILFSILAALFLMLFGLTRLGILHEPRWLSVASPSRLPGFKKIVHAAVAEKGQWQMLLLGVMMGFLPCGLSFAAFARALPAGGPLNGGLLVLAFTLGTMPGLLLLGTGISEWVKRYRTHSDIIAGLLMIYMAIQLLIKAF